MFTSFGRISKSSRTQSVQSRFRLSLEQLDDRVVPNVDFNVPWGAWDTNGNWVGGLKPGAGDTAQISDARMAFLSTAEAVSSVYVDSGAFLSLSSGAVLTLSGSVYVSGAAYLGGAAGSLNLTSGTGSVQVLGSRLEISADLVISAASVVVGTGSDAIMTGATVFGQVSNSSRLNLGYRNGDTNFVSEDYVQSGNSSVLKLDIIGDRSSELFVGDDVVLAGTVQVGHTPVEGQPIRRDMSFAVLRYADTRTGLFSNNTVAIAGLNFNVSYRDVLKSVFLIGPPMGTASAIDRSVNAASLLTGSLGVFDDPDAPGLTASDYSVTINWGDGSSSPGKLVGGSGSYTVEPLTGHSYALLGGYNASFTVKDLATGLESTDYFTITSSGPSGYQVVYSDVSGLAVWNGMVVLGSTNGSVGYYEVDDPDGFYNSMSGVSGYSIYWDGSDIYFDDIVMSGIFLYSASFDGSDWLSNIQLEVAPWVLSAEPSISLTITLVPLWT